jgi:hypothetical protein
MMPGGSPGLLQLTQFIVRVDSFRPYYASALT